MSNYIPLSVKSHFSLNQALSKPAQIAQRAVACGYNCCGLTDLNSISGTIQYVKACKDTCKCSHAKSAHIDNKCKSKDCDCVEFTPSNIKPILGCTLSLCKLDPKIKDATNKDLSTITLLAKNLVGWKNLINVVSAANKPEHVWRDQPRLSLDQLSRYSDGIIAISGNPNSQLANLFFQDINDIYKLTQYEDIKSAVRTDWKDASLALAGKYQEIFGENFYLATQFINSNTCPYSDITSKIMRWIGKKLNIACVATSDSRYCIKEDAQDHRVLLASGLKTTLSDLDKTTVRNGKNHLLPYLRSNAYHLPMPDEIEGFHEPQELQNTLVIAEQCEKYDVLDKPMLPNFICPDGMSPDDYLKKICDDGFKSKSLKQEGYRERLDYELNVITGAGLSSYFLIVQDFMAYGRNLGWLLGLGRGSSAGCLISYLSGITNVDPLEYNLLFDRFYNAGRNTKDRVSFPDIDCDIPIAKRQQMIDYISHKYGEDKVSHMITFGRRQGKSAIKDVLRVHGTCSFEEMKRITQFIPGDAEISDDLEEMRKEFGESSIIKWALENNAKELSEWCVVNENGELEGDYAVRFEQAIRMEGTKSNAGKHASGIVMTPVPLAQLCPMVYDSKTGSVIGGFEMNDMEAIGIPKFDILGLKTLDCLKCVQEMLAGGHFSV